ncbi:uncharacterized protein LOC134191977 [Corticium candelabrum]|uniref:uncharacterized protein LOC134191977 n=1 Tax=Corticium candelabrum TaxID=121492 RepID=UPI002E25FFA6|nr:uncharacterized protein LOC134191977 [Corticium candelabrum]
MDSNDHGGGDLAVNLDERNTDYDELETSGSLQYLDDCEKPIRFTDKKGSDKLPVGVLGICVKGCHINEYDVNSQCCYLITIKVQQLESSTTSTRVHTEFYASWNEVKHLPVTIYPKCSDVRNTIDFCLATVDRNKDAATVIGLAALRLHDIVKVLKLIKRITALVNEVMIVVLCFN